MDCKKTRILYIAGNGRSGSTIIDQILGQIPGWFTVGELAELWQRNILQFLRMRPSPQRLRLLASSCFMDAFHDTPDRFDFAAVWALRNRCARSRHLFLLTNSLMRRFIEPPLDTYIDLTTRLYQAVIAITGATVVVDSSKLASHAYVLEQTGAADLFVIHLVRDPRGVAYSWLKNRRHRNPAIGEFDNWHPARTSLNWVYTNGAIKRLWGSTKGRYLALRYEDFIARPEESVRRIVQLVGQPATPLPFLSHHTVSLAPTHGVSGNVVRFDTGPVRLTLDDKWRTGMKPLHKLLVTTLTAGILPRFGLQPEVHAGG